MRYGAIMLLVVLGVMPSVVGAQEGQVPTPQEACFVTLKENLAETTLFSQPVALLSAAKYSDIAKEFSEEYRSLTSLGVGVGIDADRFISKVYSFGTTTAYIHPPKNLFPSSLKSAQWKEPAGQYFITEEYIEDANGNKHFIACTFFSIVSDSYTNITADRYGFDLPGIALLKTTNDHKVWFSETPSVDTEGSPFVTWQKLFVFPKNTKNNYFDYYSVADALPTNKVTTFSVLDFFDKGYVQATDFDESTGEIKTKYYELNPEETVPIEIILPPELSIITRTGIDMMFPYASYYQAITAAFPEFSPSLSVQGTLKYATLIRLLTAEQKNKEIEDFFRLFGDRTLHAYWREKTSGAFSAYAQNDDLDRLILLVQNADWTVEQLLSGKSLATLTYIPSDTVNTLPPVNDADPVERRKDFLLYIVAIIIGGIGLIVISLRNKFKTYE